ncbi:hypothetical protein ASD00_30980 [Ensifer sp. Root31]|nr:hypothetical protein ASD00_30980 [Ensifer sp. Root31]
MSSAAPAWLDQVRVLSLLPYNDGRCVLREASFAFRQKERSRASKGMTACVGSFDSRGDFVFSQAKHIDINRCVRSMGTGLQEIDLAVAIHKRFLQWSAV